MALKYNDFAKGYGGGFKISGALPVDIRQVVEYKSDLTSSATWTGTKVYHGLLVSVHSEHQVYMFSPDSETPAQQQFDPTIEANWKKIGGSNATITAVTVEEYPGYITDDDVKIAVYQNAQEQWVRADTDEVTALTPTLAENIFAESEHSDLPTDEKGIVIEASSVINGGAGTYIKVEDEEGNISYSKINIDSLIQLINDVSTSVSNLKDYVDTQDSSLKTYVDNLSTNVDEIAQHVSDISSFIDTSIGIDFTQYSTIKEYIDSKDISEWVENVSNAVDNVSSALNQLIEDGIVNSVSSSDNFIMVDPTASDVVIGAVTVGSTDGETFANTALVTNGYVEEKLSWVEVEDQEESEEIEESEE